MGGSSKANTTYIKEGQKPFKTLYFTYKNLGFLPQNLGF